MTRRLLPADRVIAAYNVFLAVVWIACVGRTPLVPWLVAAHVAGAMLPWLLVRLPERPNPLVAAVREAYPILLVSAFWSEIDVLRPILAFRGMDGPIAALDLAVFGVHPHEIWMPAMHQMWFSELMHFSYFVYYALIGIPLVIVALQRRQDAFRDMTLRLVVGYLGCFVIFLLLPVDGPHFLMTHYAGPHTHGLFYRLVQMAQTAGDSRGCSFPSSHVVGAVTIAFLGWRWLPRWGAILLTLEAFGVFCATTYTQNHFAIDSVAGLVWAAVLQLLVVPVLIRKRSMQISVPLPVFPDFTTITPRLDAEGDR